MCQVSINSEHFYFWDGFGPNRLLIFYKNIFDTVIEINIFEYQMYQIFLGLTGAKYLIKNLYDIKIKIGIFDISNAPNFDKL